jgi:hypothetical protein
VWGDGGKKRRRLTQRVEGVQDTNSSVTAKNEMKGSGVIVGGPSRTSLPRHDKTTTRQDKTTQYKTRRHKTRLDKTRHDKTRADTKKKRHDQTRPAIDKLSKTARAAMVG